MSRRNQIVMRVSDENDGTLRMIAKHYQMPLGALAYEMLEEGFGIWMAKRDHKDFAASVDTHPQGGDVEQAPFMSGAVPEGQTPNPEE